MVTKAKRERTPRRPSLRNQLAETRAELERVRASAATEAQACEERARRAEASTESYRRSYHEKLQAAQIDYARTLRDAHEGEIKALRQLTQALTASALHTDQLVSGLADAIHDALRRVPGLDLEGGDDAN